MKKTFSSGPAVMLYEISKEVYISAARKWYNHKHSVTNYLRRVRCVEVEPATDKKPVKATIALHERRYSKEELLRCVRILIDAEEKASAAVQSSGNQ